MIYIPCWTTDCKYQEAERMSCNEPKNCCIKEGKCAGYIKKPKEICGYCSKEIEVMKSYFHLDKAKNKYWFCNKEHRDLFLDLVAKLTRDIQKREQPKEILCVNCYEKLINESEELSEYLVQVRNGAALLFCSQVCADTYNQKRCPNENTSKPKENGFGLCEKYIHDTIKGAIKLQKEWKKICELEKPKEIEKIPFGIDLILEDKPDVLSKLIETIQTVNELTKAVNELRQKNG